MFRKFSGGHPGAARQGGTAQAPVGLIYSACVPHLGCWILLKYWCIMVQPHPHHLKSLHFLIPPIHEYSDQAGVAVLHLCRNKLETFSGLVQLNIAEQYVLACNLKWHTKSVRLKTPNKANHESGSHSIGMLKRIWETLWVRWKYHKANIDLHMLCRRLEIYDQMYFVCTTDLELSTKLKSNILQFILSRHNIGWHGGAAGSGPASQQ